LLTKPSQRENECLINSIHAFLAIPVSAFYDPDFRMFVAQRDHNIEEAAAAGGGGEATKNISWSVFP
jgi:hypothetical protein